MALVDWTPEYEGSPAVWLDGADSESIDVVNGAVAVFGDRSGNGSNASQATAASRPANGASLLNGKNTVRFDGADDYLTFGTALNTLTQATVFIVVRVDADPPVSSKSGLWTMGDGADHTHYPYSDGNVYDSFGTAVRKSLGNPTPALTGWRIYSVHSRDGAWEAWLDDVLIFSTATNTFGISGDSHLGLSFLTLNHFLDGDVAELILYEGSGAISDELRENTVGYLAHKWALTGNLDPGHTYKDSAPQFDLPSSIYGEITGSVEIDGSPVQRQLIAISYEPQEHEGEETPRRIVVGETTSAADGTYTLQTPGFLGEAIVLALDNYGEVWRPFREYTVGQRIRPTFGQETGYGYDITIAGNSGETEPTWWIPAGGSDTGAIGGATAQAKPLWWSVAHAPILPTPSETISTDPMFTNVTLLLHMEGEDGSSTFTDSSNQETVVTALGDAQIDTSQFKFGSAAGAFDGGGDYLSVPSGTFHTSATLTDIADPFTIECVVRVGSLASTGTLFGNRKLISAADNGFALRLNTNGTLRLFGLRGTGNLALDVTSTESLSPGTWRHVALTYDGADVWRVFLDGALVISASQTTSVRNDSGTILAFAAEASGDAWLNGWLDEIRVTKGIARYAEPFTPPDAPFPGQ